MGKYRKELKFKIVKASDEVNNAQISSVKENCDDFRKTSVSRKSLVPVQVSNVPNSKSKEICSNQDLTQEATSTDPSQSNKRNSAVTVPDSPNQPPTEYSLLQKSGTLGKSKNRVVLFA